MPASQEPTTTPQPTGDGHRVSRKTVLRAAAALGAAPLLIGGRVALARDQPASGAVVLAPTPDCHDGDGPTVEQMEGPYFKPNSPLRDSLITSGTPGTRLTVSGYVFGRGCRPIPGVLLDFWQADDNGAYDNSGYAFRGHQFSTAQGAFSLTTIVAGLYPGRTRHLHVKLQAPGRRVVTTQLYFPGEPRNGTDTLFDSRLLMNLRQTGPGLEGTFDFVLDVPQDPTTPPTTPPPTTPPSGAWTPGRAYRAGDGVTYAGLAYRCLQAHTALAGWEPPNVPALWQRA
ncbi:carbohydrate-binding protein [Streptomyces sp. NPDC089799]|uniref:carbohydrate-binding protein n=1 Tax=Streptomyces sp. NPDC089799 TaxID=3155066 RepID=UPI00342018E8